MKWLERNIKTINGLIENGSEASLTYAALECRIAIEMFCYEKLRIEHKYIAHEDLRKWQPAQVVNQLMEEVNPNLSDAGTLSISRYPADENKVEYSKEDFENVEYLEVGIQVDFSIIKIKKLWNKLGSYLHVRLPKSNDDEISPYSNNVRLKEFLLEVVVELQRLSKGTLILGGYAMEVSIECKCGKLNRRKSELLNDKQLVNCIDAKCNESWVVEKNNDEINFQRRTLKVNCSKCDVASSFRAKELLEVPNSSQIHFDCVCGERNYILWKLMHAKK